jgi:DNA-binding protein H-NS
MTSKQLQKKREELQKLQQEVELLEKREQLQLSQDSTEIIELVGLIESTAKSHLMELSEVIDLILKKTKTINKNKIEPKYYNPNNPKIVWTGRGRKPKWVEAIESQGDSMEKYLIKNIKD